VGHSPGPPPTSSPLGRCRGQRVNRCGSDDPFDAAGQFRVQGYERVCLQLSERDVLGVVGRGPSQLIRQVPGPTPQHGVAKEPDRHPPYAGEAVARDVGGDLAPLDGLVQSRQRLGTKERRCEELVRAWDLDPLARQVEDGAGVDDEPSHRVPQIGCTSFTTLPSQPRAAHRTRPGAQLSASRSVPFGSYTGTLEAISITGPSEDIQL